MYQVLQEFVQSAEAGQIELVAPTGKGGGGGKGSGGSGSGSWGGAGESWSHLCDSPIGTRLSHDNNNVPSCAQYLRNVRISAFVEIAEVAFPNCAICITNRFLSVSCPYPKIKVTRRCGRLYS